MFGLFKGGKIKKLEKAYKVKLEEARDFQRNGDLKAYAKALEASEEIYKKIEELEG
ncbi:MAG: DUF6435 family protein [Saprospiraceae bacterium]